MWSGISGHITEICLPHNTLNVIWNIVTYVWGSFSQLITLTNVINHLDTSSVKCKNYIQKKEYCIYCAYALLFQYCIVWFPHLILTGLEASNVDMI